MIRIPYKDLVWFVQSRCCHIKSVKSNRVAELKHANYYILRNLSFETTPAPNWPKKFDNK